MDHISQLVDRMNNYPKFVRLEPDKLPSAYATLGELLGVFRHGSPEQRRVIAAGILDSTKYIMAHYTQDMAIEGRRTRSRETLLNALLAVVAAGGRSDTATGGSLMSLVLRSAEVAGIDAKDLFAEAASTAIDDVSASQVRAFPLSGPGKALLDRYGFYEKKTPEGIVYEHVAGRVSWWQKLRGRKDISREEGLRLMREFHDYHSRNK